MNDRIELPSIARRALVAALLVAAAEGTDASSARAAQVAPVPGTPAPFALVELFTSEGCSSCPPAERALTDLKRDAARTGRAAYFLEFHVDYWNRLGWTDPFSSSAASARQRAYASALGLSSVYTPQMVVQGTSEFVGSNRARAAREIAAALGRPAALAVRAEARATPAGVAVRYRVSGAPARAEIHLALVESGLVSRVAAGENRGRTLEHSGVVRAFATRGLDASGSGEVVLPPPAVGPAPAAAARAGAERRVVAFVQKAGSGAILGATSALVPR